VDLKSINKWQRFLILVILTIIFYLIIFMSGIVNETKYSQFSTIFGITVIILFVISMGELIVSMMWKKYVSKIDYHYFLIFLFINFFSFAPFLIYNINRQLILIVDTIIISFLILTIFVLQGMKRKK